METKNEKLININLFGGAGLGKSTTATGLFHYMKTNNFKVEYISEYAKDLTYGGDLIKLADQLHILGEQHHRLFRLRGKVEYIIHDSPFIMGIAYLEEDDIYLNKKPFEDLVISLFNNYNNLNILLVRNLEKEYQQYGRNQTLSEAIEKDAEIKNILIRYKIPFFEVEAHAPDTIYKLFNLIKELDKNGN